MASSRIIYGDNDQSDNDNGVISGTSGDDTLFSDTNVDTLIGGTGNDTYYVNNSQDIVIENPNEGNDTMIFTVSFTLPENVENLILNNSNISGTGNDMDNYITVNYDNDTLIGGTGNDTIDDNNNQTVMIGGTGNDTYIIRNSNSVIVGNPNGTGTVESYVSYTLGLNINNLILSGTGNLTAQGNSLNDVITANSGNDVIYCGSGNDTVYSGSGIDTIVGGTGNDTYYVNNSNDLIIKNLNENSTLDLSWISSSELQQIYTDPFPRLMANQWTINANGTLSKATSAQDNNYLLNLVAQYFDMIVLNDSKDLFLDNYNSAQNPNTAMLLTDSKLKNDAANYDRNITVLPYLNMADVWTYESTNVNPTWDFWESQQDFNGQNFRYMDLRPMQIICF